MLEAKQFKQLIASWQEEQRQLITQRRTRIAAARSASLTHSGEYLYIALARENLLLRAKRAGVRESDFERIKEIGRGAFSTVYLVRKRSNDKIFAMKIICKDKVANAVDGVRLRTERAVMLNFQSPFIVKLHYAFYDEQSLFFIMDYAAGSDISKLLDNCGALPVAWARLWFAQMLCSVLILHGNDPIQVLGLNKTTFAQALDIEQRQKLLANDSSALCSRSNSVCSIYREEQPALMSGRSDQKSKLGASILLNDDSSLVVSLSDSSNDDPEQNDISDGSNLLLSDFRLRASLPIDLSSLCDSYREFIHRDLKPQNFLLTAEGNIMLADFGFAKELQHGSDEAPQIKYSKSVYFHYGDKLEQGIVGTLNYIAPEQFKSGMYGKCVDYWALGCILYEMLAGEQAVSGESEEEIVGKLITLSYEELLPSRNDIEEDAWDLITGLLYCPEQRYGRSSNIAELLQHPFFTLGKSVADIAYIKDPMVCAALAGEEIDYDQLPILPIPELLIRISMPWKPILQDEEDLQYFAKSNLFETKQINFSDNSPLSSYFSNHFKGEECVQGIKFSLPLEKIEKLQAGEAEANQSGLSHESSMSQSVIDVRKCTHDFMETVIPSPRGMPRPENNADAMGRFAGIDYTVLDDGQEPARFARIDDFMGQKGHK